MNTIPDKFKDKAVALIVCKVIMRARVPSAASAVGSILVDHVNWKSFRCDPSIGRLVKLSGYSRSNVQTGLKALEEDGIIIIHRHGGLSGRNRYEFCWDEIFERDDEFQKALHSGRAPTRNQGANCSDIRAQTLKGNPKKEPDRPSALTETSFEPTVSKGQARRNIGRGGHPVFRSPASREAWETDALKRWNDDLTGLYRKTPDAYAVAGLIDTSVADAATKAEMKRRGDGLRVILDHVGNTLPALAEKIQPATAQGGDGSSLGAAPLAVSSDPDLALVRLRKTRVDNG